MSLAMLVVIALYEKCTAKMKNKKLLQKLAEQANVEDAVSEWENNYKIISPK